MSARHSPAVAYPLRRSRVMWGLWACWVAGSAVALLLWWCLGAGWGSAWWWRVGVSGTLWLLCAWAGWRGLQQLAQGLLHWDGQRWAWEQAGVVRGLPASPVVLVDVQWLLVIAFAHRGQRTQRMVLQRDWAPHAWLDVRRAVYSFAHPPQETVVSEAP